MKNLVIVLTLACLLFTSLPATCATVLEGFDPSGSGPGYLESASGRSGPKPSLRAHRVADGPIEIDVPPAEHHADVERQSPRRHLPVTENLDKLLFRPLRVLDGQFHNSSVAHALGGALH